MPTSHISLERQGLEKYMYILRHAGIMSNLKYFKIYIKSYRADSKRVYIDIRKYF